MSLEVSTPQREAGSTNKEVKRIASIEFLRGIAILFMVFIHSLYKMYDYQWIVDNPEQIAKMPIPLLVLIGILGYFGMWIFFFVLLSGIVNAYSMTRKFSKTSNSRTLLYKQIITGLIIILIGKIKEGFIGYWGYFGQLIRSGDWSNIYPIKNMFFEMKALDIIGWCYIITGLIHYLLLRNRGYKRYWRNVIIYLSLVVMVIVATPFISQYAKSLDWKIPSQSSIPLTDENRVFIGWPSVHVATANPSLKTWFLVLLVGANDPLFPYLAVSFIGALIGMTLAQEKIPKHFMLSGNIFALLSFIIGTLLIAFHIATDFPTTAFSKPPDVPMFLILLSGQIAVVMGFLKFIEFRDHGQEFANTGIFRFIRKWSVVSLTVFVLELYEILIKWIISIAVSVFYPLNLLHHGVFTGIVGIIPAFIFSTIIVLSYDLLIRAWSLIDFTGSFEWLIIQMQYLIMKERSAKLTIDTNRIKWISFTSQTPA